MPKKTPWKVVWVLKSRLRPKICEPQGGIEILSKVESLLKTSFDAQSKSRIVRKGDISWLGGAEAMLEEVVEQPQGILQLRHATADIESQAPRNEAGAVGVILAGQLDDDALLAEFSQRRRHRGICSMQPWR